MKKIKWCGARKEKAPFASDDGAKEEKKLAIKSVQKDLSDPDIRPTKNSRGSTKRCDRIGRQSGDVTAMTLKYRQKEQLKVLQI